MKPMHPPFESPWPGLEVGTILAASLPAPASPWFGRGWLVLYRRPSHRQGDAALEAWCRSRADARRLCGILRAMGRVAKYGQVPPADDPRFQDRAFLLSLPMLWHGQVYVEIKH